MILLFAWAAMAVIGLAIGNTRGRGGMGAALGAALGPVGWIVTLLLPEDGPRCPECRGVLAAGARRCRHCGAAPLRLPPPLPPVETEREREVRELNARFAAGE